MSTVQEIELAITALSAQLSELSLRLDENHGRLFDERIAADFGSGRLDNLIQSALNEDAAGRTV